MMSPILVTLSVLEEYAKGLQNGDARLANRGLNYLQTEFGANNVTNFNTAKQIVATEISHRSNIINM